MSNSNVITGAGSKAGRRPARLRTDKRELERVIRALYERGLGCRIIGKLTGYSSSQIHMYAKDWGMPMGSPAKTAEWFESLLPEDLRADLRLIRTRSSVYVERSKKKTLPVSPYTHNLLVGREKQERNSGGTLRPQETEAA